MIRYHSELADLRVQLERFREKTENENKRAA